MNAKILFTVLAVATAAASGVARADEYNGSQYALKFTGTRTRAEVQAEAVKASATHNPEPAGSRVQPVLASTVDMKAVRSETIQAARAGKIPSGEMSF